MIYPFNSIRRIFYESAIGKLIKGGTLFLFIFAVFTFKGRRDEICHYQVRIPGVDCDMAIPWRDDNDILFMSIYQHHIRQVSVLQEIMGMPDDDFKISGYPSPECEAG